jgi:hypothetical protein
VPSGLFAAGNQQQSRIRDLGQHLADLPAIDAWLAQDLQADKLAAKPFCPMPVLGVPGWWPANEEASFYADTGVFRPLRHAAPPTL